MVYIDGVHDSKAYGAINHFETTQYRAMLEGITKKDTHTPDFDVTLTNTLNWLYKKEIIMVRHLKSLGMRRQGTHNTFKKSDYRGVTNVRTLKMGLHKT